MFCSFLLMASSPWGSLCFLSGWKQSRLWSVVQIASIHGLGSTTRMRRLQWGSCPGDPSFQHQAPKDQVGGARTQSRGWHTTSPHRVSAVSLEDKPQPQWKDAQAVQRPLPTPWGCLRPPTTPRCLLRKEVVGEKKKSPNRSVNSEWMK